MQKRILFQILIFFPIVVFNYQFIVKNQRKPSNKMIAFNINKTIDQDDSTNKCQQIEIRKKKIRKQQLLKRHVVAKKNFVLQSPEESSNECDGWIEEENFNEKSKKREENQYFRQLQSKAWKMEALLVYAKNELATLEASLSATISQF